MTNLARGGVILTLMTMMGSFFLFEIETDAALIIAKDSKGNIQQSYAAEQTDSTSVETIVEKPLTEETSSEFSEIENLIEAAVAVEGGKSASAGSFSATAYCLKGRTASGAGVRRGIVAADRRILPLGTRINLKAGAYSGNYVVADTGGAIKGRKLDIWVANCSEARRFGRRNVTVNR